MEASEQLQKSLEQRAFTQPVEVALQVGLIKIQKMLITTRRQLALVVQELVEQEVQSLAQMVEPEWQTREAVAVAVAFPELPMATPLPLKGLARHQLMLMNLATAVLEVQEL
jgi:hypothetical protein